MLDARFLHLYFCQILHTLQRCLVAIYIADHLFFLGGGDNEHRRHQFCICSSFFFVLFLPVYISDYITLHYITFELFRVA